MDTSGRPTDLEPTTLDLAEELARRVACEAGYWTIELRFAHGRLIKWYRHHGPGKPEELEALREAT